ncbi:MAG: hypothetical protein ABJ013_07605 [Halioglobus sp.]
MKRYARLLIKGALLIGCVPIASADHWVTDPIGGCQVWSYGDAADKETVSWSGGCEAGKAAGRGVLVVSDPAGLLAVYDGEMSGGHGNGFASLRFRNDDSGGYDTYLGRFETSLPQGRGIFESSEGWRLEGEFAGSFETGSGTLYVKSGGPQKDAVIRGSFKDGELTGPAFAFYELENGEIYFGDIEEQKRQGTGTLIHPNDDTYIGDFEDGVASGYGVYEGADGDATIGEFENGAPTGAATYIAVNGDRYQGIFQDGVPEGMVLITKADGTQIVETWKNGEKQQ